MAQAYPSLTVLIIGDGPQRPELDWLARTLDLGRGSCRDFAVLFVEAARTPAAVVAASC